MIHPNEFLILQHRLFVCLKACASESMIFFPAKEKHLVVITDFFFAVFCSAKEKHLVITDFFVRQKRSTP